MAVAKEWEVFLHYGFLHKDYFILPSQELPILTSSRRELCTIHFHFYSDLLKRTSIIYHPNPPTSCNSFYEHLFQSHSRACRMYSFLCPTLFSTNSGESCTELFCHSIKTEQHSLEMLFHLLICLRKQTFYTFFT